MGLRSLEIVLYIIADSMNRSYYDGSFLRNCNLRPVQYFIDDKRQKEKAKVIRNNYQRVKDEIPQQPRYNRQFGNGGLSGRVPYHMKKAKYHRSKCN